MVCCRAKSPLPSPQSLIWESLIWSHFLHKSKHKFNQFSDIVHQKSMAFNLVILKHFAMTSMYYYFFIISYCSGLFHSEECEFLKDNFHVFFFSAVHSVPWQDTMVAFQMRSRDRSLRGLWSHCVEKHGCLCGCLVVITAFTLCWPSSEWAVREEIC